MLANLTPNEYQRLAMRTVADPDPVAMLMHGVFGLASEAGEVAGIMQKVLQGHDLDSDHMAKELGDCLWMIAEICESMDLKLEDVMEMNIQKLRNRYPNGFETDRSIHRSEGDI